MAPVMAMSSESLRTVRDRSSEFVDCLESHHERVVVTKNGMPAAVLISTVAIKRRRGSFSRRSCFVYPSG